MRKQLIHPYMWEVEDLTPESARSPDVNFICRKAVAAGCPTVQHNSSQFWHYLPADSIRFRRLRVQSYKTPPPPRSQSHPRLYTVLLTGWLQSRASHDLLQLRMPIKTQLVLLASDQLSGFQRPPPWVQRICQSGTQTSEKPFTYYITGLLQKARTQEQPGTRDAQGKLGGEGAELPRPLHSHCISTCLPTWKVFWPSPLGVLGDLITQSW